MRYIFSYGLRLALLFLLSNTFVLAFRVIDPDDHYPNVSGMFPAYSAGFVGRQRDPTNTPSHIINEGNPFSLAQPNIFRGVLPRQSCPGMIGPIDRVYYCTSEDSGYCDRRSGTCFCNPGYQGRDCGTCRESHYYNISTMKCEPRVLCPNDCSGNGVCDPVFGVCKCREGRRGADCSLELCRTISRWCKSCRENDCVACDSGYFLDPVRGTCESCTFFDPRCSECSADGCSSCVDPLLRSIRRSGQRKVDPVAANPVEERIRPLKHQLPFGTKEPEAVFDSESFYLISSAADMHAAGIVRSTIHLGEACLSSEGLRKREELILDSSYYENHASRLMYVSLSSSVGGRISRYEIDCSFHWDLIDKFNGNEKQNREFMNGKFETLPSEFRKVFPDTRRLPRFYSNPYLQALVRDSRSSFVRCSDSEDGEYGIIDREILLERARNSSFVGLFCYAPTPLLQDIFRQFPYPNASHSSYPELDLSLSMSSSIRISVSPPNLDRSSSSGLGHEDPFAESLSGLPGLQAALPRPLLNASTLACETPTGSAQSSEEVWRCRRVISSHSFCGSPGQLSFVSPEMAVSERDERLPIVVRRSGGGLGRVEVELILEHITTDAADVSLPAGFSATLGSSSNARKLVFEEGVVELKVYAAIHDDRVVEPANVRKWAAAGGHFASDLPQATTSNMDEEDYVAASTQFEQADLRFLRSLGLDISLSRTATVDDQFADYMPRTGASRNFSESAECLEAFGGLLLFPVLKKGQHPLPALPHAKRGIFQRVSDVLRGAAFASNLHDYPLSGAEINGAADAVYPLGDGLAAGRIWSPDGFSACASAAGRAGLDWEAEMQAILLSSDSAGLKTALARSPVVNLLDLARMPFRGRFRGTVFSGNHSVPREFFESSSDNDDSGPPFAGFRNAEKYLGSSDEALLRRMGGSVHGYNHSLLDIAECSDVLQRSLFLDGSLWEGLRGLPVPALRAHSHFAGQNARLSADNNLDQAGVGLELEFDPDALLDEESLLLDAVAGRLGPDLDSLLARVAELAPVCSLHHLPLRLDSQGRDISSSAFSSLSANLRTDETAVVSPHRTAPGEQFALQLRVISGGASLGTYARTVVTIVDDDVFRVSAAQSDYFSTLVRAPPAAFLLQTLLGSSQNMLASPIPAFTAIETAFVNLTEPVNFSDSGGLNTGLREGGSDAFLGWHGFAAAGEPQLVVLSPRDATGAHVRTKRVLAHNFNALGAPDLMVLDSPADVLFLAKLSPLDSSILRNSVALGPLFSTAFDESSLSLSLRNDEAVDTLLGPRTQPVDSVALDELALLQEMQSLIRQRMDYDADFPVSSDPDVLLEENNEGANLFRTKVYDYTAATPETAAAEALLLSLDFSDSPDSDFSAFNADSSPEYNHCRRLMETPHFRTAVRNVRVLGKYALEKIQAVAVSKPGTFSELVNYWVSQSTLGGVDGWDAARGFCAVSSGPADALKEAVPLLAHVSHCYTHHKNRLNLNGNQGDISTAHVSSESRINPDSDTTSRELAFLDTILDIAAQLRGSADPQDEEIESRYLSTCSNDFGVYLSALATYSLLTVRPPASSGPAAHQDRLGFLYGARSHAHSRAPTVIPVLDEALLPNNAISSLLSIDARTGTLRAHLTPRRAGLHIFGIEMLIPGGLRADYFADALDSFGASFSVSASPGAAPFLTRVDPHLNFTWGTGVIASVTASSRRSDPVTSWDKCALNEGLLHVHTHGAPSATNLDFRAAAVTSPGGCVRPLRLHSSAGLQGAGWRHKNHTSAASSPSTDSFHRNNEFEHLSSFSSASAAVESASVVQSRSGSVRWSGAIVLPPGSTEGLYEFFIVSDGLVRVYVDDEEVVSRWGVAAGSGPSSSPFSAQSAMISQRGAQMLDSALYTVPEDLSTVEREREGSRGVPLYPSPPLGLKGRPEAAEDTLCVFASAASSRRRAGAAAAAEYLHNYLLNSNAGAHGEFEYADTVCIAANDAVLGPLASLRSPFASTFETAELPLHAAAISSSLRDMRLLARHRRALGLLNAADVQTVALRFQAYLRPEVPAFIGIEYAPGPVYNSFRLLWLPPAVKRDHNYTGAQYGPFWGSESVFQGDGALESDEDLIEESSNSGALLLPRAIPSRYLYSVRKVGPGPVLTYVRPGKMFSESGTISTISGKRERSNVSRLPICAPSDKVSLQEISSALRGYFMTDPLVQQTPEDPSFDPASVDYVRNYFRSMQSVAFSNFSVISSFASLYSDSFELLDSLESVDAATVTRINSNTAGPKLCVLPNSGGLPSHLELRAQLAALRFRFESDGAGAAYSPQEAAAHARLELSLEKLINMTAFSVQGSSGNLFSSSSTVLMHPGPTELSHADGALAVLVHPRDAQGNSLGGEAAAAAVTVSATLIAPFPSFSISVDIPDDAETFLATAPNSRLTVSAPLTPGPHLLGVSNEEEFLEIAESPLLPLRGPLMRRTRSATTAKLLPGAGRLAAALPVTAAGVYAVDVLQNFPDGTVAHVRGAPSLLHIGAARLPAADRSAAAGTGIHPFGALLPAGRPRTVVTVPLDFYRNNLILSLPPLSADEWELASPVDDLGFRPRVQTAGPVRVLSGREMRAHVPREWIPHVTVTPHYRDSSYVSRQEVGLLDGFGGVIGAASPGLGIPLKVETVAVALRLSDIFALLSNYSGTNTSEQGVYLRTMIEEQLLLHLPLLADDESVNVPPLDPHMNSRSKPSGKSTVWLRSLALDIDPIARALAATFSSLSTSYALRPGSTPFPQDKHSSKDPFDSFGFHTGGSLLPHLHSVFFVSVYTPRRAGHHSVAVTVNKEHIFGSPFLVSLLPSVPVASTSSVVLASPSLVVPSFVEHQREDGEPALRRVLSVPIVEGDVAEFRIFLRDLFANPASFVPACFNSTLNAHFPVTQEECMPSIIRQMTAYNSPLHKTYLDTSNSSSTGPYPGFGGNLHSWASPRTMPPPFYAPLSAAFTDYRNVVAGLSALKFNVSVNGEDPNFQRFHFEDLYGGSFASRANIAALLNTLRYNNVPSRQLQPLWLLTQWNVTIESVIASPHGPVISLQQLTPLHPNHFVSAFDVRLNASEAVEQAAATGLGRLSALDIPALELLNLTGLSESFSLFPYDAQPFFRVLAPCPGLSCVLNVRLRGMHVAGSPFHFSRASGVPVPAHSQIFAPQLGAGVRAGETLRMVLQLRDAQGNAFAPPLLSPAAVNGSLTDLFDQNGLPLVDGLESEISNYKPFNTASRSKFVALPLDPSAQSQHRELQLQELRLRRVAALDEFVRSSDIRVFVKRTDSLRSRGVFNTLLVPALDGAYLRLLREADLASCREELATLELDGFREAEFFADKRFAGLSGFRNIQLNPCLRSDVYHSMGLFRYNSSQDSFGFVHPFLPLDFVAPFSNFDDFRGPVSADDSLTAWLSACEARLPTITLDRLSNIDAFVSPCEVEFSRLSMRGTGNGLSVDPLMAALIRVNAVVAVAAARSKQSSFRSTSPSSRPLNASQWTPLVRRSKQWNLGEPLPLTQQTVRYHRASLPSTFSYRESRVFTLGRLLRHALSLSENPAYNNPDSGEAAALAEFFWSSGLHELDVPQVDAHVTWDPNSPLFNDITVEQLQNPAAFNIIELSVAVTLLQDDLGLAPLLRGLDASKLLSNDLMQADLSAFLLSRALSLPAVPALDEQSLQQQAQTVRVNMNSLILDVGGLEATGVYSLAVVLNGEIVGRSPLLFNGSFALNYTDLAVTGDLSYYPSTEIAAEREQNVSLSLEVSQLSSSLHGVQFVDRLAPFQSPLASTHNSREVLLEDLWAFNEGAPPVNGSTRALAVSFGELDFEEYLSPATAARALHEEALSNRYNNSILLTVLPAPPATSILVPGEEVTELENDPVTLLAPAVTKAGQRTAVALLLRDRFGNRRDESVDFEVHSHLQFGRFSDPSNFSHSWNSWNSDFSADATSILSALLTPPDAPLNHSAVDSTEDAVHAMRDLTSISLRLVRADSIPEDNLFLNAYAAALSERPSSLKRDQGVIDGFSLAVEGSGGLFALPYTRGVVPRGRGGVLSTHSFLSLPGLFAAFPALVRAGSYSLNVVSFGGRRGGLGHLFIPRSTAQSHPRFDDLQPKSRYFSAPGTAGVGSSGNAVGKISGATMTPVLSAPLAQLYFIYNPMPIGSPVPPALYSTTASGSLPLRFRGVHVTDPFVDSAARIAFEAKAFFRPCTYSLTTVGPSYDVYGNSAPVGDTSRFEQFSDAQKGLLCENVWHSRTHPSEVESDLFLEFLVLVRGGALRLATGSSVPSELLNEFDSEVLLHHTFDYDSQTHFQQHPVGKGMSVPFDRRGLTGAVARERRYLSAYSSMRTVLDTSVFSRVKEQSSKDVSVTEVSVPSSLRDASPADLLRFLNVSESPYSSLSTPLMTQGRAFVVRQRLSFLNGVLPLALSFSSLSSALDVTGLPPCRARSAWTSFAQSSTSGDVSGCEFAVLWRVEGGSESRNPLFEAVRAPFLIPAVPRSLDALTSREGIDVNGRPAPDYALRDMDLYEDDSLSHDHLELAPGFPLHTLDVLPAEVEPRNTLLQWHDPLVLPAPAPAGILAALESLRSENSLELPFQHVIPRIAFPLAPNVLPTNANMRNLMINASSHSVGFANLYNLGHNFGTNFTTTADAELGFSSRLWPSTMRNDHVLPHHVPANHRVTATLTLRDTFGNIRNRAGSESYEDLVAFAVGQRFDDNGKFQEDSADSLSFLSPDLFAFERLTEGRVRLSFVPVESALYRLFVLVNPSSDVRTLLQNGRLTDAAAAALEGGQLACNASALLQEVLAQAPTLNPHLALDGLFTPSSAQSFYFSTSSDPSSNAPTHDPSYTDEIRNRQVCHFPFLVTASASTPSDTAPLSGLISPGAKFSVSSPLDGSVGEFAVASTFTLPLLASLRDVSGNLIASLATGADRAWPLGLSELRSLARVEYINFSEEEWSRFLRGQSLSSSSASNVSDVDEGICHFNRCCNVGEDAANGCSPSSNPECSFSAFARPSAFFQFCDDVSFTDTPRAADDHWIVEEHGHFRAHDSRKCAKLKFSAPKLLVIPLGVVGTQGCSSTGHYLVLFRAETQGVYDVVLSSQASGTSSHTLGSPYRVRVLEDIMSGSLSLLLPLTGHSLDPVVRTRFNALASVPGLLSFPLPSLDPADAQTADKTQLDAIFQRLRKSYVEPGSPSPDGNMEGAGVRAVYASLPSALSAGLPAVESSNAPFQHHRSYRPLRNVLRDPFHPSNKPFSLDFSEESLESAGDAFEHSIGFAPYVPPGHSGPLFTPLFLDPKLAATSSSDYSVPGLVPDNVQTHLEHPYASSSQRVRFLGREYVFPRPLLTTIVDPSTPAGSVLFTHMDPKIGIFFDEAGNRKDVLPEALVALEVPHYSQLSAITGGVVMRALGPSRAPVLEIVPPFVEVLTSRLGPASGPGAPANTCTGACGYWLETHKRLLLEEAPASSPPSISEQLASPYDSYALPASGTTLTPARAHLLASNAVAAVRLDPRDRFSARLSHFPPHLIFAEHILLGDAGLGRENITKSTPEDPFNPLVYLNRTLLSQYSQDIKDLPALVTLVNGLHPLIDPFEYAFAPPALGPGASGRSALTLLTHALVNGSAMVSLHLPTPSLAVNENLEEGLCESACIRSIGPSQLSVRALLPSVSSGLYPSTHVRFGSHFASVHRGFDRSLNLSVIDEWIREHAAPSFEAEGLEDPVYLASRAVFHAATPATFTLPEWAAVKDLISHGATAERLTSAAMPSFYNRSTHVPGRSVLQASDEDALGQLGLAVPRLVKRLRTHGLLLQSFRSPFELLTAPYDPVSVSHVPFLFSSPHYWLHPTSLRPVAPREGLFAALETAHATVDKPLLPSSATALASGFLAAPVRSQVEFLLLCDGPCRLKLSSGTISGAAGPAVELELNSSAFKEFEDSLAPATKSAANLVSAAEAQVDSITLDVNDLAAWKALFVGLSKNALRELRSSGFVADCSKSHPHAHVLTFVSSDNLGGKLEEQVTVCPVSIAPSSASVRLLGRAMPLLAGISRQKISLERRLLAEAYAVISDLDFAERKDLAALREEIHYNKGHMLLLWRNNDALCANANRIDADVTQDDRVDRDIHDRLTRGGYSNAFSNSDGVFGSKDFSNSLRCDYEVVPNHVFHWASMPVGPNGGMFPLLIDL